ncbi:hypothetical protein HanPSC8_Chr17g0777001 [Helianthus annuus]|nr:hypothetical protein HanPSC8_Chr17g0777001 [Helianthus annuus]
MFYLMIFQLFLPLILCFLFSHQLCFVILDLNRAITAGVLSAISDIVSQKLSCIQKLQIRRILLKVFD